MENLTLKTVRTIKRRLKREVKFFLKGSRGYPIGLCAIIQEAFHNDLISDEQYRAISSVLNSKRDEQIWFYTFMGDLVQDESQFIWKPNDYESRLAYLEGLIKELKKK